MADSLPAVVSADSQLPAAASGGGAVTVQPSAVIETDAAARGALVGDRPPVAPAIPASPSTGYIGAIFPAASSGQVRQLEGFAKDLVMAQLGATGATNEQLRYALEEVLPNYVPLYMRALRTGDQGEIARLDHNCECDLVAVGALTVAQRDAAREARQRMANRSEWALVAHLQALHASRPTTLPNGDEARIGEIVKLMGDPSSAYWKGATAEPMQAEYRRLINQLEQRNRGG